MRIEAPEFTNVNGLPRWSARVVYEDQVRETPPLTIASEALSSDAPPAEFFLLTQLPGALAAGERRVRMEGDLDKTLAGLVRVALGHLSAWYFKERPIPVIEAGGRLEPDRPRGPGSAMLLSGGADSMALLCRLRRWFPPGHSRALTEAILIEGFDISLPGQEVQADYFRQVRDRLRPVCEARGIRLWTVHTNLRDPALAPADWPDQHFGLAGAAVGHALTHRIRELHIAGGLVATDLFPHGSHPLLEPFASGGALRVHHHLTDLGRLDRVRLLAGEPDLAAALRVCWVGIRNNGPLNCGVCHKCVMTRLECLVAGIPATATPFTGTEPTVREVRIAIRENTPHSIQFLKELIDPLIGKGRKDLAAEVRRKVRLLEAVARASAPASAKKRFGWRRWL